MFLKLYWALSTWLRGEELDPSFPSLCGLAVGGTATCSVAMETLMADDFGVLSCVLGSNKMLYSQLEETEDGQVFDLLCSLKLLRAFSF